MSSPMIAANLFNTIGTSFGSARSVKTGNIVGSSTITDMTRFSVTPIADGVGQLLVPVTFSRGVSGQPAQNAEYLISQTLVNNAEGWHITTILPVANTQTPTLASESDPRTGHPAGSVVTLMRDFRFVFRQMRGKSEVTVVNRPL